MSHWNFFTNHGHVIFVLSQNPKITSREVAQEVGITERATQKIISDLEQGGFIKIKKDGRNNIYKVNGKKRLRHDIEKGCQLNDLIEIISENSPTIKSAD